ncbi:MAG: Uma2 family endonuclease [Burkholderiales bacterium]|nr:Uma2 family endonuclease [Anaerolineae bacterium]
MAQQVENKLVMVDEFEEFIALPENRVRLLELVNGEIVEKMPTEEHGAIASKCHGEIYIFLKQNPIGRLTIEARYRPKDDQYNDRLPDVSFTSAERALPLVKKGAVPQMPDLAIEVKSPDDTYKEMREKAAFYLANGARMVWLVYPEKRMVEVYRLDADIDILTNGDVIDGADVLPGFTLAISDMFN